MEETSCISALSIISILLIAVTALVIKFDQDSEDEGAQTIAHILFDENSMEIIYFEEDPRVMEPVVFHMFGAPPNSTIIWDFGESDSRLFGEVLTYRFNTSAYHLVNAEVRYDGSRITVNTTVPVRNRDQCYETSTEFLRDIDHFRFGPLIEDGITIPAVKANTSIGAVHGALRTGVFLVKGQYPDPKEIPLKEHLLEGPLSDFHLNWNISAEEISEKWGMLPFRVVVLIEALDGEEVSRGENIECSIEVIY